MMNIKQGMVAAVACLSLGTVWAQGNGSAPTPAKVPNAALIKDESVSSASLKSRYPAGSITAVKQADAAIADTARGRERAESVYLADEKACYQTFFANSCVTEAKERRRVALAELKRIQVEAERFKRHDTVVHRDQALEEKRRKDAATVRPDPNVDKRAENYEAKREEAQHKAAGGAGKRTENEAAFAKKARDREATQRKVEERRARTEQRRKSKAASAAAAAANRAAAASSASSAAASASR